MNKIRRSKTTGIFKNTELPLQFCRLVENHSLVNSVTFSYFECLTQPGSKSLISDCEVRLKCIKKSFDSNPVKGVKKFLSNPTQELLEILKNNLDLFVKYIENLLEYYSKKHPEKFGTYPQNLQNPEHKRFDLLAKITKTRINVHKIEKPMDIFDTNIKKNKDFCINLLQISQNQFCILYRQEPVKILQSGENIISNPFQTDKLRFGDLGHSGHLVREQGTPDSRQLKDTLCPPNSDFLQKCPQCHSFRDQLSFPESPICHNCIVLNSISEEAYKSSQLLNCRACSISKPVPLFPTDFIPIPCPDNHDFLCRACWSNSLDNNSLNSISEQEKNILCPYNSHKINGLSKLIYKILEIRCLMCSEMNCKYYGDFSCANDCIVCITCQVKDNRKVEYRFKCPVCTSEMVKKSDPWNINCSLDNLDDNE